MQAFLLPFRAPGDVPPCILHEYTAPKDAKVKLKDQHFFELKGSEWFWIGGIVKHDRFTMLTIEPGPDMKPFHDGQICVLRPEEGMHWLPLSRPASELLRSPPEGTFKVTTLRENGRAIAV
jgi:putative SOS response-associated peptidase YedK